MKKKKQLYTDHCKCGAKFDYKVKIADKVMCQACFDKLTAEQKQNSNLIF